jgi:hypothetical protein
MSIHTFTWDQLQAYYLSLLRESEVEVDENRRESAKIIAAHARGMVRLLMTIRDLPNFRNVQIGTSHLALFFVSERFAIRIHSNLDSNYELEVDDLLYKDSIIIKTSPERVMKFINEYFPSAENPLPDQH